MPTAGEEAPIEYAVRETTMHCWWVGTRAAGTQDPLCLKYGPFFDRHRAYDFCNAANGVEARKGLGGGNVEPVKPSW